MNVGDTFEAGWSTFHMQSTLYITIIKHWDGGGGARDPIIREGTLWGYK